MTQQLRPRAETKWRHRAPTLALLLLSACAESGGRDGSQTHFSGAGGNANGDTTEPASEPSPTTDDDIGADDDATDADDDAANEADDDSAGDDAPDDDDTTAPAGDDAPGDDDTTTTEDDALDDDTPASASDDDVTAPTPTAAGGTGGGPQTPDDCPDGNCVEFDPCEGLDCGDACDLCFPGDECTGQLGMCDRDGTCSQEAVNCSNSNLECSNTAEACGVERPLCSPTEFESTDDDCVEQSWVWDGGDCISVEHCGCASGDCERVHPDVESCESAHAACLPRACIAQDAQSSGFMCGTLDGYAFDGATCTEVLCGCRGEDCADIEPTEEGCQARFAECLARAPQCVPTLFPVEEVAPGYDPTYPPFGFGVEGYDELYDAETETVAVFADWTPARYGGLEEVSDSTTCPPIGPLRFSFNCPAPRPLLFEVDGEIVRVHLTLHWDTGFEMELPTDVEMRISPHPTGTLVLEIRDTDAVPVLVVVNERTDVAGADGVWEFPPFTFAAAEEARCTTPPDACDWTFSALNLQVSTEDQEQVLVPSERGDFEVDGTNFAALHGYIFKQSAATPNACATTYPWRQNFVLVRALAQ